MLKNTYLLFFILISFGKQLYATNSIKDNLVESESSKPVKVTPQKDQDGLDDIPDAFRKLEAQPYQLRYQVLEDLKFFDDESLVEGRDIEQPILCIGTGKNKRMLLLSHSRPTIVQSHDLTIDVRKAYEPDWSINAFNTECLDDLIRGGHRFHMIYFAHVANYFPQEADVCQKYRSLLKPGGCLLYKSSAFFQDVHIPSVLDMRTFEDLKSSYERLFQDNGFDPVHIVERSEYGNLIEGDVMGKSFMIKAKRARKGGKKDDNHSQEEPLHVHHLEEFEQIYHHNDTVLPSDRSQNSLYDHHEAINKDDERESLEINNHQKS